MSLSMTRLQRSQNYIELHSIRVLETTLTQSLRIPAFVCRTQTCAGGECIHIKKVNACILGVTPLGLSSGSRRLKTSLRAYWEEAIAEYSKQWKLTLLRIQWYGVKTRFLENVIRGQQCRALLYYSTDRSVEQEAQPVTMNSFTALMEGSRKSSNPLTSFMSATRRNSSYSSFCQVSKQDSQKRFPMC